MEHRKNHVLSAFMGVFIVLMLGLMAGPLALILLSTYLKG